MHRSRKLGYVAGLVTFAILLVVAGSEAVGDWPWVADLLEEMGLEPQERFRDRVGRGMKLTRAELLDFELRYRP